jgi:hypothetical protein
MVDGTHQLCWLFLQALFMIARVLTANNTTAARTINKGLCIATLDHCETPEAY